MAKRGVRKRNVKNRRPDKARVVPPDGVEAASGDLASVAPTVPAQCGPADPLSGRLIEYRWTLGSSGSVAVGRLGGSVELARSRTAVGSAAAAVDNLGAVDNLAVCRGSLGENAEPAAECS